jgi:acyl dehydratase
MDVAKVLARDFGKIEQGYTFKDSILYALGIGLGSKPLDPGHLRFLYEDGLLAMPSMANVLGHPGFWANKPEYAIDWKKLLHAEQRMVIHAAIPPEGKVISQIDIMGIRDLGTRGTMMHQRKILADAASGQQLATTITSLMLRGDTGSGNHGEAPDELKKLPETGPDHSTDVEASEILPLIYRLSGDLNPLHIDPAVAEVAGFPRPILHGLATKGIATYAILSEYCDLDPARLKSMSLRFSRPVLPGDVLRFDFWNDTPGTVRFRAAVPARDLIVLDRGVAEIEPT